MENVLHIINCDITHDGVTDHSVVGNFIFEKNSNVLKFLNDHLELLRKKYRDVEVIQHGGTFNDFSFTVEDVTYHYQIKKVFAKNSDIKESFTGNRRVDCDRYGYLQIWEDYADASRSV